MPKADRNYRAPILGHPSPRPQTVRYAQVLPVPRQPKSEPTRDESGRFAYRTDLPRSQTRG